MEEKDIKRVLEIIGDECGFFFTAKKQKEIIRAIKRFGDKYEKQEEIKD